LPLQAPRDTCQSSRVVKQRGANDVWIDRGSCVRSEKNNLLILRCLFTSRWNISKSLRNGICLFSFSHITRRCLGKQHHYSQITQQTKFNIYSCREDYIYIKFIIHTVITKFFLNIWIEGKLKDKILEVIFYIILLNFT